MACAGPDILYVPAWKTSHSYLQNWLARLPTGKGMQDGYIHARTQSNAWFCPSPMLRFSVNWADRQNTVQLPQGWAVPLCSPGTMVQAKFKFVDLALSARRQCLSPPSLPPGTLGAPDFSPPPSPPGSLPRQVGKDVSSSFPRLQLATQCGDSRCRCARDGLGHGIWRSCKPTGFRTRVH